MLCTKGDKMLKKLNRFLKFDAEGFFAGKRFKAIGMQEWKDFETGKVLGKKIEVVIASDKTDYGCTDGEVISNVYEKLVFKVRKNEEIPMGAEVKPINPLCSVYGEYRNQLSIVCERIDVLGNAGK